MRQGVLCFECLPKIMAVFGNNHEEKLGKVNEEKSRVTECP